MKATRIKTISHKPVSAKTLVNVCFALERAFKKAGFVSGAKVTGSSSLKIGLHMCSFRIDTAKLGHNADTSCVARKCKAGFKRTNIPTWKQREAYNHLVNDVFDKFYLRARICNSVFEIRNYEAGRINKWPMFGASERVTHEICSITELT